MRAGALAGPPAEASQRWLVETKTGIGDRRWRRSRTDAEFAQLMDELTRRGFLAGGLAGKGLLGLSARSGGTVSAATATVRKQQVPNGDVLRRRALGWWQIDLYRRYGFRSV